MSANPTKVPGFFKIPANADPQLKRYLENLEEAIEIRLGRRGDPIDRAVTLRELIDSGMAKRLIRAPFDPNKGGPGLPDFADPDTLIETDIPIKPTSFTVSGAYSQINMSWDFPNYKGHNQTEIWGHSSNVIGSATLVGVSTGLVFSDPVGGGVTKYYWIRHVNTKGVFGPWFSTTGVSGTTATDVAHQLNVLTGAITSSELATALSAPIGNLPANTQNEINTLTGRINDVNEIPAWATGTSYSVDDLVVLSSKRYRALQNHTSSNSNQPSGNTSDNAYWRYIGVDDTVTIEQMFLINARTEDGVDHLDGQYTVKIDANGHVAGFGLANTTNAAGTNTSEFYVNADRFAILPDQRSVANTAWTSSGTFGVGAIVSYTSTDFGPRVYYAKVASNSSNSQAPVITVSGNQVLNSTYWYDLSVIPFAVQAAPATASDGTVIPPGVYMNMASIKYASIEAAKIGSVNADTINAGYLNVAGRIDTGAINASKINLNNSSLVSQEIDGIPTLIIGQTAIKTGMIDNAVVNTLQVAGNAISASDFVAKGNNSTNHLTLTMNDTPATNGVNQPYIFHIMAIVGDNSSNNAVLSPAKTYRLKVTTYTNGTNAVSDIYWLYAYGTDVVSVRRLASANSGSVGVKAECFVDQACTTNVPLCVIQITGHTGKR